VIPVQVAKTTTTTTTLNAAPAQSKTAAGTDHAPSQTLRTSHRNIQSIPTTTAAAHLAKLLGYDPEASAVDQGSGSAKINPIPILAPKKHTIVHSPGQSPERKKAILSQVDSKGKGQEPQPASTQQAPLPATKALLSEQNLRMQGMVEKPQRQNSVWTNTYVEDMRKRAAEAKVEKEKNETKLKKTEEDKATKAMKEMEKKMESELKKLDEEMLKLRKMMGARK
jgi:O6-methylguanine-DNA--protein-cysteine methyltransferase